MEDEARAEAWIRDQVAQVRDALRRQPPGPHDPTLAEIEQPLRDRADAIRRPTGQYVGLPVDVAQEAATGSGDRLCVHRGPRGHRANWSTSRVHVDVGDDGRVLSARRDKAPWEDEP